MADRIFRIALALLLILGGIGAYCWYNGIIGQDESEAPYFRQPGPRAQLAAAARLRFFDALKDPEIANFNAPPAGENYLRTQFEIYKRFTQNEDQIQPPPSPGISGYGPGDPASAKLILLGLDGSTWKILTPLLKQGLMPNLSELLENSSYGWFATDEANSPVSWTTIAAGKGSDKSFFTRSKVDQWDSSVKNIRAKRLWDMLPTKKGDGLCMANYFFQPNDDRFPDAKIIDIEPGAPSSEATNQCAPFSPYASTNTCLIKQISDFVVDEKCDQIYTIVAETDELKHRSFFFFALKYLGPQGAAPVLPAANFETDFAEMNKLINAYRNLDYLIGFIRKKAPEAIFIVLSDHGFQTQEPITFVKPDPALMSQIGLDMDLFKNSDEISTEILGTPCKVYLNLDTYGFALARKSEISDVQLDHRIALTRLEFYFETKELAQQVEEELQPYRKFWKIEDLPFFEMTRAEAKITLSMPKKIAAAINKSGRFANLVPLVLDSEFGEHFSGDAGIFIASGPAIAKGKLIDNASVFDVTPTVLYLKGQPVAKDMDGRVMTEILDPKWLAAHPISTIETYGDMPRPKDESDTKRELPQKEIDHLKSLGYLE